MANYTPKLNLKMPLATEGYSVADQNGNMIILDSAVDGKVPKPLTGNGTNGQLLRTNGDGTTAWTTQGAPTDEQVSSAVEDWLDENVDPATGYVLDRTLSMSNAATPADITGSLKSAFDNDGVADLHEKVGGSTNVSRTVSHGTTITASDVHALLVKVKKGGQIKLLLTDTANTGTINTYFKYKGSGVYTNINSATTIGTLKTLMVDNDIDGIAFYLNPAQAGTMTISAEVSYPYADSIIKEIGTIKANANEISETATDAVKYTDEIGAEKAGAIERGQIGTAIAMQDIGDKASISGLVMNIGANVNGYDIVNLTIMGKNIINDDVRSFSMWDRYLVTYGDAQTTDWNRGYKINGVKAGLAYTVTVDFNDSDIPQYLRICEANPTAQTSSVIRTFTLTTVFARTKTFVAKPGCFYYLVMATSNTETTFNSYIAKLTSIQMEMGDAATAYEAYKGITYKFSKIIDVLGAGANQFSNWDKNLVTYGNMKTSDYTRGYELTGLTVGKKYTVETDYDSSALPQYFSLCKANPTAGTSVAIRTFTSSVAFAKYGTFTVESGYIYYLRYQTGNNENTFNSVINRIKFISLENGDLDASKRKISLPVDSLVYGATLNVVEDTITVNTASDPIQYKLSRIELEPLSKCVTVYMDADGSIDFSCGVDTQAYVDNHVDRLKVMTFNVGLWTDGATQGLPEEEIPQRSIDWHRFLGEADPTFMMGQEAPKFADADQEIIAYNKYLKFKLPYFMQMLDNNWIPYYLRLSFIAGKLPIRNMTGAYFASGSGRGYIIADCVINGKTVTLINTHLDSSLDGEAKRHADMTELNTLMNQYDYCICCGDFNADNPEDYATYFDGKNVANVGDFGTFNTDNAPIDNIITTSNIIIQNVQLGVSGLSDHKALMAEIVLH